VVRVNPNDANYYGLSGQSLPLTIPNGVTFDITGCGFAPDVDSSVPALFDVRPGATVLAPGVHLAIFGGFATEASVFRFDADQGDFETDRPTYILGYPFILIGKSAPSAVEFVQTTGGNISNVVCEVGVNTQASATIDVNSADSTGFINMNEVRMVGHVRGENLIHQRGSGAIGGNEWNLEHGIQVQSANRLWYVESGGGNLYRGVFADTGGVTTTPWEWTTGAGDYNLVVTQQGSTVPQGVNNSTRRLAWRSRPPYLKRQLKRRIHSR
jgi:hypothetical protein